MIKRGIYDHLIVQGFRYYPLKKQVVMARPVTLEEAPLLVMMEHDIMIAETGDMIYYQPDPFRMQEAEEIEFRALPGDEFHRLYTMWDESWHPTTNEELLMAHGCQPYYKRGGVWAKRLDEPQEVDLLDGLTPITINSGEWLVIGDMDEPFRLDHYNFRKRYEVPVMATSSASFII